MPSYEKLRLFPSKGVDGMYEFTEERRGSLWHIMQRSTQSTTTI